MRLLRLSSNGEGVADVTNNFKESIIMKAGTQQVAVQSLSIAYPYVIKQPTTGELEFNFTYKTGGAVISKSGEYREYADAQDLLNHLNRVFNSTLSLATYGTSRRTEFNIYQSGKTNNLIIKYYANTDDTFMDALATSGITVNNGNISKTASTPGTLDYAIAKKFINSGMANFLTTITDATAPNGLIIGLCQGVSTTSQLTASDIYHGVIVKSGNYYDYKFDTDTGEAYTTGDKIHTLIQNGNIEIFLEKAAAPGVLIDLIITNNMTNDFRLYGFYASEEPFSITSGEYSPSPYISVTDTGDLIDNSEIDDHFDNKFYLQTGELGAGPPSGAVPQTVITLVGGTARFLGFNYNILSGKTNTISWTSSSSFLPSVPNFPESLAIELPGFMVQSYDNRAKGRRGFIHYSANPYPNSQQLVNQYIYNANELIFVDVKLLEDMPVNQFQFRILDANMAPIPIDECYLVLVFN